jgi:putative oxidoreductase
MAPDTAQREPGRESGKATALKRARLGAGAVFVIFGLGKFLDHAAELSSFETYGIPWPELMVYAVGVLEVVGGLALLAGVAVAPVALLMAGNMAVAIVVSGIGEGEVVPSLTLAPVLLIVMVLLLWAETRARRPRPC